MALRRLNVLLGLLGFCFPELAFAALRAGLPPRWAGEALLLLVALRWGRTLARKMPLYALLPLTAGLAAAAWFWGGAALRYYPVVMNVALLSVFAASLRRGPSMVERLARLQHPDLDARGVVYTRRVTQVWCGFFVLNGSAAAAIGYSGDTALWALYNGFIAYMLMGLLFAGEWLVRRRVMAARTA